MRYLILAGALLLAGPAFAQSMDTPSTANSQSDGSRVWGGAKVPDLAAVHNANQNGMPHSQAVTDLNGSSELAGAEGQPDGRATTGSRLYSRSDGFQLVSNGPVPDTASNRAKYKPLSRKGRNSPAEGR